MRHQESATCVVGPDGELVRKHRKLMPTGGERLVWGFGDGSDLDPVETPFGRVGGLICWENLMPLARTAIYAKGVDPIAVLDIQRIIRFLKERGIGVLITDHNVRETLGICDRAYIINEGAVLASGHPEEIVYNDSVRRVYLGENFRM